jgi:hypothetical protein
MTRSLFSIFKFDFVGALYYHPLVYYLLIVTPVIVCMFLRNKDKQCKTLVVISACLLIAVYLYRMIIAHSPVLECSPENGIFPRIVSLIGNLFQ